MAARVASFIRRVAPVSRGVTRMPTRVAAPRSAFWGLSAARNYGGGHVVPSTAEIEAKVISILGCFDKIDQTKLQIDTSFQVMGLDSLDIVECVMALEDEFAIELSDTQAELISSPRDMIPYIEKSFE
eukprot:m.154934 g.154934  ORF g.154934 m.154934 type:complete len:128 (+) comp15086_c0_seq2:22-405(+)